MTTPVPARAHANMSVAERELTFDSLLAEFGELEVSEAPEEPSVPASTETRPTPTPIADAAAPTPASPGTPQAARPTKVPRSRPLLPRLRAKASPEVLKLSGLIAVAALSLILVFIALSR